jgi:hypothetical protein
MVLDLQKREPDALDEVDLHADPALLDTRNKPRRGQAFVMSLHVSPELDDEAARHDSLATPAAGPAVLSRLASQEGVPNIALDSIYPGREETKQIILEQAERALMADAIPVLMPSVLQYNAAETEALIRELKAEIPELIVVVGGQAVQANITSAWVNMRDIDVVARGDGEVLMGPMLADIQAGERKLYYEGFLKNEQGQNIFEGADYRWYIGMQGRLQAQRETMGFARASEQLVGGPGCSWAFGQKVPKACRFCALQGVTTRSDRPLDDAVRNLRVIQDQLGLGPEDQIFDVANQHLRGLLPREARQQLEEMIRLREEYGVHTSTYAYLTVGSVASSPDIAHLLAASGVTEVYLGIDHVDPRVLKIQNKHQKDFKTILKAMEYLKDAGIRFRGGLVLGIHETRDSLNALMDGLEEMLQRFGPDETGKPGNMTGIGIFPVDMLPGSEGFRELETLAREKRDTVVLRIISNYHQRGYILPQEAERLRHAYIEYTCRGVGPAEIMTMADRLHRRANAAGIIGYRTTEAPGPEVMTISAPQLQSEAGPRGAFEEGSSANGAGAFRQQTQMGADRRHHRRRRA